MRTNRFVFAGWVMFGCLLLIPIDAAGSDVDAIDAVQQKLDAAKRAQAEKEANARRDAEQRRAREEADRQAQARSSAAPKAPDLPETLEWLRAYFASTTESFEAYDSASKTLSTTQRSDSTTTRWAYDICSARRISPILHVNWDWAGTTANGYIRISWAGTRGCKGPEEACVNWVSGGWAFSFPRPTTLIATEPNPSGGTRIAAGATEAARDRLLADGGHPVHRFRRAFERLVELECGGTVDSPFE